MGYARHIGRLGALAVALGIGYAVTDAPAFADTADAAGDTSAVSVTAAKAPSGATRAARRSRSATAANSAAPAPRSAAATRRANRNAQPGLAVKAAKAAAAPSASVRAPAPEPASTVAATADPTAAPVVAASAAVRAPKAAVVQSAPRAAATTRVQPVKALAQFLNSTLAPLLTGNSGAPAQSQLLFTVLAWARKEFDGIIKAGRPAAVVTNGLQSPNLLVNPGAEMSSPSGSGFSAVSMPGWTVTGTPTVIEYGTPRVLMPLGIPFALPDLPSIWSFPKADSGPADGGNQFFGGGNVADSTISQTVDLSAAHSAIDGGNVSYDLAGWLGGYGINRSKASIEVTFLDENATSLGSGKVDPVTALDRRWQIGLLERATSGVLPVGTRYARVEVIFDDKAASYGISAGYNSGFADNISFAISADLPAPADPQPIDSSPPALDHFFLFYMENKGYSDIVGSANAPFLNGLIDTYGFSDNYYALTHGSLPNYYPIVGGDNFGITYNCTSPCIDADTTLVSNLADAGLTWKAYAQGLAPGGDPLVSTDTYAFDETAFPAFKSIASDPNLKDYMVPLEQMVVDLTSPDTTPNYVWVDPNEANNGEGPVDSLGGVLKFAFNQIDPKHQYNVPALDAFLDQNVTAILDSAAWKSPDKSVIAVTFDEDNNNLSLGFGNEGNHIVTVIIPNQAAIDAGWKGGSFTASGGYNHYSLLRMIEDSLGLPTLTNNDKYATPMNEFWDGPAASGAGSLT